MKIADISCFDVKIPFTRTFAHGSASRNTTETVLVRVTGHAGIEGWGEGCPRAYVTGESLSTVQAFIEKHRKEFRTLTGLSAVQAFVDDNRREIDANPSAWCAVELALLDLAAKTKGANIESLLGRNIANHDYVYTAVLGDSSPETFHELFGNYAQLGFTDYKIKLCDDPDRDRAKLEVMLDHVDRISVRADANNLWQSAADAIDHLSGLAFPFYAIEEPLRSRSIEELATVTGGTGLKVILDESLLNAGQLHGLENRPGAWLVNARLSKYGGLLRSLDLINELGSMGIGTVVGTHVGETSLLTRAAWILADAAGDHLVAQEGGFSTHLLDNDLFYPNIRFGKQGRLDSDLLECRKRPGFGLEIDTRFDTLAEVNLLE